MSTSCSGELEKEMSICSLGKKKKKKKKEKKTKFVLYSNLST